MAGTKFPNGASIGGGVLIKKIDALTPSLSPTQVAANTTAEQTFTVNGLLATDIVTQVIKPTTQAGLGIVGFRVSAANTLAITFANNTASPITPTASEVYKIVVISI